MAKEIQINIYIDDERKTIHTETGLKPGGDFGYHPEWTPELEFLTFLGLYATYVDFRTSAVNGDGTFEKKYATYQLTKK